MGVNFKKLLRKGEKKGLSIIELLIAIGVVAVLASAGGTTYLKFHQKVVIDSDANKIVAELRNVTTKAKTCEEGVSWGIKFVNTDGRDYFQVLKSDEDTIYKTVYLRPGVQFGDLYDPDDPETATTIFSEMFQVGPTLYLLDAVGSIELSLVSRECFTDTITISELGVISRVSNYGECPAEEGDGDGDGDQGEDGNGDGDEEGEEENDEEKSEGCTWNRWTCWWWHLLQFLEGLFN